MSQDSNSFSKYLTRYGPYIFGGIALSTIGYFAYLRNSDEKVEKKKETEIKPEKHTIKSTKDYSVEKYGFSFSFSSAFSMEKNQSDDKCSFTISEGEEGCGAIQIFLKDDYNSISELYEETLNKYVNDKRFQLLKEEKKENIILFQFMIDGQNSELIMVDFEDLFFTANYSDPKVGEAIRESLSTFKVTTFVPCNEKLFYHGEKFKFEFFNGRGGKYLISNTPIHLDNVKTISFSKSKDGDQKVGDDFYNFETNPKDLKEYIIKSLQPDSNQEPYILLSHQLFDLKFKPNGVFKKRSFISEEFIEYSAKIQDKEFYYKLESLDPNEDINHLKKKSGKCIDFVKKQAEVSHHNVDFIFEKEKISEELSSFTVGFTTFIEITEIFALHFTSVFIVKDKFFFLDAFGELEKDKLSKSEMKSLGETVISNFTFSTK